MFPSKYLKNVGIITVILTITLAIYFPTRHARRYECLRDEDILKSLNFEWKIQDNLKNCNYRNVIFSTENEVKISEVAQEKNHSTPNPGGEYKPTNCNPLLNSAIIIPYRKRSDQLKVFLNYMHHFLQKQNLHYRMFLVDQNNNHLFNRANLLNIGAKVAMDKDFSCLIFHDVDLIPLNYGNIYGCSTVPRHMSSSLDTFRYNLPYLTLFGGAVAILSEQFKLINGMSNKFEGWGGEDDDLYKRLEENDLVPCRFCPSISRYTMLFHKKNLKTSEDRFSLLQQSKSRRHFDGLNTLNNNYTIELKPLFTHIVVS